jgi:hypothetical protein
MERTMKTFTTLIATAAVSALIAGTAGADTNQRQGQQAGAQGMGMNMGATAGAQGMNMGTNTQGMGMGGNAQGMGMGAGGQGMGAGGQGMGMGGGQGMMPMMMQMMARMHGGMQGGMMGAGAQGGGMMGGMMGGAGAQGMGMQGMGMQFAQLDADADGDGNVTPEELRNRLQTLLTEYDADGNGTLSLDEFAALHADLIRESIVDRFQFLDDDGDGAVTAAEIVKPAKLLEQMQGAQGNMMQSGAAQTPGTMPQQGGMMSGQSGATQGN